MNEEEIRKKYQRDDETDPRGTNAGAINRFIELLHLHEKSDDVRVRNIAEHFSNIDKLAPNFQIFQAKDGQDSLFMHNFKAYKIAEDSDMLVIAHEFGHAVLSIMNDTTVPENYEKIIENAKKHAVSPENKENFKAYVQYLAGKTDEAEKRTKAEKGPLSDIISSIFQYQGLRINTNDNICMFPSSHPREYYYDEEKKRPNLKHIFDEDFANYYTLKVNNCTEEIETLKSIFGEELLNALDEELTKASEKLVAVKDEKEQESIDNSEGISI